MNIADKVLRYGLYKHFRFNKRDKHLREVGLYCEEIFPSQQLPPVLRRLAKNPVPKLALIPAKEVIISPLKQDSYALYMPMGDRLISTEEKQKPNGDLPYKRSLNLSLASSLDDGIGEY